MNNLKLIKSIKVEKLDYINKYKVLFNETLKSFSKDNKNRTNLKRLSLYGVRLVNETIKCQEYMDYEKTEQIFNFVEIVKIIISLLTPNEVIKVFPIDKVYNGEKYGVKDYFFTMNELYKIGMNNMINENIENFLFDYENKEIRDFSVNSLSILSKLYKAKTGEGIMEKWANDNGITVYNECRSIYTNKTYLYNAKTGKSIEKKINIPKYLKLIK